MSEIKKFEMWLEPYTPDGDNPCAECVLGVGLMCLDRSYCEQRKTGKTWRKCSEPPKSDNIEAKNITSPNKSSPKLPNIEEVYGAVIGEFPESATWTQQQVIDKVYDFIAGKIGR